MTAVSEDTAELALLPSQHTAGTARWCYAAAFAGMQAILSTHRNRQLPGARIMHQGCDQITFLPQQLCHLLLLRLKEELHNTHIVLTTPKDVVFTQSCACHVVTTPACIFMPFDTIDAPIFCCDVRMQDRREAC